jgi:hypothetical protein
LAAATSAEADAPLPGGPMDSPAPPALAAPTSASLEPDNVDFGGEEEEEEFPPTGAASIVDGLRGLQLKEETTGAAAPVAEASAQAAEASAQADGLLNTGAAAPVAEASAQAAAPVAEASPDLPEYAKFRKRLQGASELLTRRSGSQVDASADALRGLMEEPEAAILKQIKDDSDAFNTVIYLCWTHGMEVPRGLAVASARAGAPQRQMMSTQRQGQKRRRKLPASHESSPFRCVGLLIAKQQPQRCITQLLIPRRKSCCGCVGSVLPNLKRS